jgi:D-alanyl-D-alanine carboxypeptidase (penicillin-binding protein 5/6)
LIKAGFVSFGVRSRRKWSLVTAVVVVLAAIIYCGVALLGSPGELRAAAAHTKLVVRTKAARLPWPAYGQGAYGVAGGPVLATHGVQKPVPTASVAKLITVLCVLAKQPITASTDGPALVVRPSDVAIYDKYVAEDGSVVPVRAGQRISERKALEAILLPSANNVADSLAISVFGSLANYRTYATGFLRAHGLNHTRIGSDASGFLPDTTSTATDLVKLGSLAMSNRVIAPIVGERSVDIPGSGTFANVDSLLGTDGIVGIKTGNSDQDGGVFVGAVRSQVGGRATTVITALAGAQTLDGVLADSRALLVAAGHALTSVTVARAGETVGRYVEPDGGHVDAVVRHDVTTTVVRGSSVRATIRLRPIGYGTKAGATVGTLELPGAAASDAQAVPIVLARAPSRPGIGYRLLHP